MKSTRILKIIFLGLIALVGSLAFSSFRSRPVLSQYVPLSRGTSLIIDLRDNASSTRIEALRTLARSRFGVTLKPVASAPYNPENLFSVTLPEEATSKVLLETLASDPLVETISENFYYSIPEQTTEFKQILSPSKHVMPKTSVRSETSPNDPLYPFQWNFKQINLPTAWQHSQGADVVVAVIDTGVTPVEDLQGTTFVAGWNFVDDNDNTSDDHGHGTHVAGTIAQTTNNSLGVAGIAYRSKIMPLKVLSASGSGSVAGIADACDGQPIMGLPVINMSLGGPLNSTILAKAVRYAYEKGVVVVCAAGNDGRGRVSYPAANYGSLAVAATQYDETTTFYSNWGKAITIAAPGGNTRVDQNNDGYPDGIMQNTVTPGDITKHDYLLFMGTSMAAPHVAAVAALLVSAGVSDPSAVKDALTSTAHRPSHYKGQADARYGAGIMNAGAALAQVSSVTYHITTKHYHLWLSLFTCALLVATLLLYSVRFVQRFAFIAWGTFAVLTTFFIRQAHLFSFRSVVAVLLSAFAILITWILYKARKSM